MSASLSPGLSPGSVAEQCGSVRKTLQRTGSREKRKSPPIYGACYNHAESGGSIRNKGSPDASSGLQKHQPMPKTILTCAVTGGAPISGNNPAVPVTPAQIAQQSIDAAKAGAAVVHIHVRDPATSRSSMELDLYREVVARIRDSGSDVVINLTTGTGGMFVPGKE